MKAIRLDKTTVGKALQKLEEKGFVIREQCQEDKRKKILHITESGMMQISNVMDLHDIWLNSILSCLSAEEQKQFENYCKRLLVAAESLAKNRNNGGINHAQ